MHALQQNKNLKQNLQHGHQVNHEVTPINTNFMKAAREWVLEYTQSGAFDMIASVDEAVELVNEIQQDALRFSKPMSWKESQKQVFDYVRSNPRCSTNDFIHSPLKFSSALIGETLLHLFKMELLTRIRDGSKQNGGFLYSVHPSAPDSLDKVPLTSPPARDT